MSFLGLYLASVIGTKACPKEPVPPVIRIVELEFIKIFFPFVTIFMLFKI